ncbi:bifunctional demethylmenaquinone methyltransferase/2-methoxy-6-polyprenyl-1,4-benzoquinol methylase UbiE [Luteibaculum oceani]|uniref:Demethylmenaquinone methyltransferase n=1 Tax=Luteibaculum oceani TaxID=1294296 RepID=A0A5C6V061_9FLAO|nr:bifunctional demethylmenaquinone methyltransferase/2-methoxy-6-polyprenyl-1,4-benzoquinol methylase UbiE [Luteibaculum oceani]TXC78549.1 bifunctional demethylmenaquinone methyltransferase/2-methoxy-6-polyprenyl-1,4-benzoquinol methylase UbiE [Luteibaculum oceani]
MVTPYKSDNSKKAQVADMFNNIAAKYDFLNHFFSLGIDHLWRRKAIKMIAPYKPKKIVDFATGTGDFAIASLKLSPEKVVGVDISEGMLSFGNKKIEKRNLQSKVTLKYGDAENLPFKDGEFDAFTVGFGVRNYENLEKGLTEMKRVLRPGGVGAILEFSKPKMFPLKQLYFAYFKWVMPLLGKWFSKDSSAYTYLPESVMAFPEGKDFENICVKVGFKHLRTKPVTGGIASIYLVQK